MDLKGMYEELSGYNNVATGYVNPVAISDHYKGIDTKIDMTDEESAMYDMNRLETVQKSSLDPLSIINNLQGMRPYYDFSTSNASAKFMQKVLKRLGIKNNYFHLLLFDTDLVGVDPFAESTMSNPVLIRKIRVELERNPFYYFREIFRIRTEKGGTVPFRFDIGNLTSLFLQLQGFNIYKEQPRQTGKTVYELGMIAYNFNFRCENTKFGLYHYDDPKVKESLQTVLSYLNELPEYLKFYKLNFVKDKDGNDVAKENQEIGKSVLSVEHKARNNKITAKTCGQSADSSDRVGRGATQAIQYWDEIGFVYNIKNALASGIPAFNTASENAASGNNPYYLSLTSTPPNAAKEHGMYLYNKFKVGAVKFELFMFDMSYEAIKKMMVQHGDTDVIFISYQYYELGFSEEWAIKQKRLLDIDTYMREILLLWIKDYTKSPFDRYDIDKIDAMTKDVKSITVPIMDFYQIKFYEYLGMSPEAMLEYFKDKTLIIGIDVSAGLGGNRDKSTMCGTCPETGETVFTFRSNEANTRQFSNLIYLVVKQYFSKAILVIERNSYGQGVIDNLAVTDIEPNLYYTNMTKSQEKAGVNANKSNRNGKFMYGIFNQNEVRDTLYGMICVDMVKSWKRIIKSRDIFEEISTVTYINGRYDHEPGSHDDLLIAKLFSLFPLLYDRVMQSEFGVAKPTLLNDDEYTLLEFESSLKDKVKTKTQMLNSISDKGYYTLSDIQEIERMNAARLSSGGKDVKKEFNPYENNNGNENNLDMMIDYIEKLKDDANKGKADSNLDIYENNIDTSKLLRSGINSGIPNYQPPNTKKKQDFGDFNHIMSDDFDPFK